MSEQPPLASPSGPDPAFEQYAAPAWGQASPEPGAGQPQAGRRRTPGDLRPDSSPTRSRRST